ncbi:MAG: hypothetical protein LBD61_04865 [Endomicrobium sp.]|nr:hypothetical protein [Endomicrobium sp.]
MKQDYTILRSYIKISVGRISQIEVEHIPFREAKFLRVLIGIYSIYHKIAAKRAIKELQKAERQSEISQEAKYRKNVIEH